MRFTSISGELNESEKMDVSALASHIQQMERELRQHLMALGLGDGVNPDNFLGAFANFTTNAVANTEDAITHNLGLVPIGFITLSLDKGAVLYKGTTAWTTSQIFLKSTVASTVARIFILAPSNTQH